MEGRGDDGPNSATNKQS